MAKKRFDPLWEIVDEKIALQEAEPDIDLPCPYCNVRLHLGPVAPSGSRVKCGLCGGRSEVAQTGEGIRLVAE